MCLFEGNNTECTHAECRLINKVRKLNANVFVRSVGEGEEVLHGQHQHTKITMEAEIEGVNKENAPKNESNIGGSIRQLEIKIQ